MVEGLKPLLTIYQVGSAFIVARAGDSVLLPADGPDALLRVLAEQIQVTPDTVQVAGGQVRPASDYPPLEEDLVEPQRARHGGLREERIEVLEGPGGRERRFKVGYDENPVAPPPPRVEQIDTNNNRVRGQIHNIQQLSTAYLRGQYKGQPFTRKDWVDGVQQWAPDVPFPMAEQVLSEVIAEANEDREGI